jgi:hypothetical protein
MSLLDLLAPEITETIRQLVVDRILNGGNLAAREDLPRATVKLVLIIMMSVHPHEVIYQEEAAILYGVSRNTFAKRQSADEFAIKANVGK